MWLVCQDHLEDLDLSQVTEGDPVATFDGLVTRLDVEHRVLWGSVALDEGHIAWVFGAANDEARTWWLAVRGFQRLPGRLGSSETSWELTFGNGNETCAGPAAALRRPGPPLELLPAQPPPFPKLGWRVDDIPPNADVPTDPVDATNVLSQIGEEVTAAQNGMEGVLVVLFRGRTLERWRVFGEIPCGLDDLVRAMVQRGDECSAVVTMRIDLFEYQGTVYRVVKTVAEAGGKRFERMLAMRYAAGDDDHPAELQLFGSVPTDIVGDGWIGVAPLSELEWFDVGPQA
jgi:hypothetical protein